MTFYHRLPRGLFLPLVCCFLAALAVSAAENGALYPHARATAENATALDRYVAQEDPAYDWELVRTRRGSDWTGYIIELTSQTWRSADEVDRPVWQHWLNIIVPDEIVHDTPLLLVGGGRNTPEAPASPDYLHLTIARGIGAVTASLGQIPNEPLQFADEDKHRNEDAIIAYTWDKFMKTGDAEWLLRLPMTKATVRAMDTIQAFCASEADVSQFLVAGASKRGWTTWTVGAVDKRVAAMCPMVIDLLNIVPSFRHHWSVYGFWAPAVKDYEQMAIMERMETPEYEALMEIVEPYSYNERYDFPKYLVSACGDQFFLPDSAQFYIDDLTEPAWIRYVPNVGHSLMVSDAPESVIAFYRTWAAGETLPTYDWSFPDAETIRVTADQKPEAVHLWQATNPERRDFRVNVLGRKWESTPLTASEDGAWTGQVDTPDTGWTAYMVELTFAGPTGRNLKITTPVRVVPEETPYTYTPAENPEPGFLSE